MKVLIAAACVAVIAAVGYFFWREYRGAQDAEVIANERMTQSVCATISEQREPIMFKHCRDRGFRTSD